MKYFTLFVCVLLAFGFTPSESFEHPVQWNFSIEKIDESTAYFVIKADIEAGWRVFGEYPYLKSTKVKQKGGDIPTIHVGTYEYTDSSECTNLGPVCLEVNYSLGGKLVLETIHSTILPTLGFDEIFAGELFYYENEIELRQKIKYIPNQRLKGYVSSMACNDEKCYPPTSVDFDIMISN